jgi:hypothetical protein
MPINLHGMEFSQQWSLTILDINEMNITFHRSLFHNIYPSIFSMPCAPLTSCFLSIEFELDSFNLRI